LYVHQNSFIRITNTKKNLDFFSTLKGLIKNQLNQIEQVLNLLE